MMHERRKVEFDIIEPLHRAEHRAEPKMARKQRKAEFDIIEPASFERHSADSKPASDEEYGESELRIPSQKEAEDDIDSLLASWSEPPATIFTKGPPSPRPSANKPVKPKLPTPPSPRPAAAKPAKPDKSRQNDPPARTPSFRVHEAPGLPPIKSYGPSDYPTNSASSSRRPAAPSPPLSAPRSPRAGQAEAQPTSTLRTGGSGRTRRPRSEEIPKERVTRYILR